MMFITKTEIIALNLLGQAGMLPGYNTTNCPDAHTAGNKIIELAEQIKSERAVAAMEVK
jgi:hypothetical protein